MGKFVSVEDAFHYLESFTNLEKSMSFTVRNYKLDRMKALLGVFGDPHKGLKTIHIAGSKGKGSTGIFCASILDEAGYKTGFYSSPHVSSYKERITHAGKILPDSVFIGQISRIREYLEIQEQELLPAEEGPTTFELLTLLAFLVFRETGCLWAVIETGIGGRLDSTNVILPDASVITPLELEHTDILGGTLEKIAYEKSGIIKDGIPVFSSFQKIIAEKVIRNTAAERGSELHLLEENVSKIGCSLSEKGTSIEIAWTSGGPEKFDLSMTGEFQAENAALAVLTLRKLAGTGKCEISEKGIRKGLKKAVLPGRMEIIRDVSPFLLDGAHTRESAKRLVSSFREIFDKEAVCIFGSVSGKDAEGMAGEIAPEFSSIIISRAGTFKKSDPEGVFNTFKQYKNDVFLRIEPKDALKTAIELSQGIKPVLVTGSFYMVAEIRKLIKR